MGPEIGWSHTLSIDFRIAFNLLLTKGTQRVHELGSCRRLCHILLALYAEVNSVRLLLCIRQGRFAPKFLISLASYHYRMSCQFCKRLGTAFYWAVYVSKNIYLLKH